MLTEKTDSLKDKIEKAKSLSLVVPKEAGLDGIAGALALKSIFGAERQVFVVFDGRLPPEAVDLPGADGVLRDLDRKDLVLKFNIGKVGIEKITYQVENSFLTLRVKPKEAQFDIADFNYAQEGLAVDLVVTFGVQDLKNLSFYTEAANVFQRAEVINLGEPVAGKTVRSEVAPASAKSICQFIFEQLVVWEIAPSKDASLCLLKGISY